MSMRWIEDNRPSETFPLWTRANIGEVALEPANPLSWDLVTEPGTLHGWRDCAVERFRVNESELDPDRPEVAGLFGGYMYLNASAVRLFGHRAPDMTPEQIDRAYFGDHPDVPPFVHEPWHDDPDATAQLGTWMTWVLTTDEQPELEADREVAEAARASRPDVASLSFDELVERARSFTPDVRRMFNQHIHQSGAASIGPGVVAAVAEAVGDPTLTLKIIGAVGDVDSAAPSYALWDLSRAIRRSPTVGAAFDAGHRSALDELARSDDPVAADFLADFARFIERFGSRGPNEWDLYAHTWETDPTLVTAILDGMRRADDDASPTARHGQREAERAALVDQVTSALAADPTAQAQFLAGVASSARFVAGRERSKTSIIKVIHEQRMATWEIGRRLVDTGALDDRRHVCFLFVDELKRALDEPGWARETIAPRIAHYEALRALEPPFLFQGPCPPVESWRRKGSSAVEPATPGTTIQAVPGSSGTYRGRARIVLDPSDPSVLEPGDVLVAPHTDPAWTPLFVSAGAVVVDVGAALSHAIIVSRELGLPCVVSATDATRRIADGATVEVDGDRGTVSVL